LVGKDDGATRAEGGVAYRGDLGDLNADLSAIDRGSVLRLGARGGLVLAEGSMFVTRRVENSFAVVEVKDIPDIGVGINGHQTARTNSRGLALVSNLQALVPNHIRLNEQDLPVDAEIASVDQVVVPPLRRAVKIVFPVRAGRSVLLTIQLEDGEPVPSGAVIRVEGDDRDHWVGRGGKAFVTNLQQENSMVLKWNEQSCRLNISLPARKDDDIARLGPVTCAGVKR
jgi:outer membrane usher protein